MRHDSPASVKAVRPRPVRHVVYLLPEEIERLEIERRKRKPRASDGRFGLSSVVRQLVRERLGMPPA